MVIAVESHTVSMAHGLNSSIKWLLSVRVGQAHFGICLHLAMEHHVMATSCALDLVYILIICSCVCMCACVCACVCVRVSGSNVW